MRRISLAALMVVVLFFAVGFAALRSANELWDGCLLSLNFVLLGTALLGIVYWQGSARASSLGYVIFGGGYLFLAVGPSMAEAVNPRLPSTRLLQFLGSREEYPPPSSPVPREVLVAEISEANARIQYLTTFRTSRTDPALMNVRSRLKCLQSQLRLVGEQSPGFTAAMLRYLSGPTSQQALLRVGHDLVALLAGLLGVVIARLIYRTRDGAWTSRSVERSMGATSPVG